MSAGKGVSCVVVTFTVGGLSVVNAVAGAYSDGNVLMIRIVQIANDRSLGISLPISFADVVRGGDLHGRRPERGERGRGGVLGR
jgi:hypothetical protein